MSWKTTAPPTLAFVLFVAAWQLTTLLGDVPVSTLPSPTAVLAAALDQHAVLLMHALHTSSEALAGFAVAAMVGLGIGVTLTSNQILREILYPHLVALQVIPKIALAPLFLVWFGIGPESRVVLAAFISFFPVAIATATGLMETDDGAVRLCRVLGASRRQTLFYVRFPNALPFIFDGLKVAATLSMIGVVVGEFISSKRGLGFFILNASSRIDTASVIAAIAVLCVAGMTIYGMTALLEATIRKHWWPQ